MRKLDRRFFQSAVGLDGLVTFILSNLVLVVTLGIFFWVLFIKIINQAKTAPDTVQSDSDFAIVTGYLLDKQDQIKPRFKQRLDAAFNYLTVTDTAEGDFRNRANSNRKIFILGGKTGSGMISEASAGRDYLLQKGVELEKISIEEDSQHTLENLFNIRKRLGEESQNASIFLITSRYHLARSLAMAQGLGMIVQPLAAEDKLVLTPEMLVTLIKEAYLLHWYYIGKWWTHLTKNQNSLDRIS